MPEVINFCLVVAATGRWPTQRAVQQVIVITGEIPFTGHPQANHKVDHMLPVGRVIGRVPENIIVICIPVTINICRQVTNIDRDIVVWDEDP